MKGDGTMLSVCHVAAAVGRIALLMLGVMLSWPAMDWANAITVPLTGGTSGFNGGTLEFHAIGPDVAMSGIDPFVTGVACNGGCPAGSVVTASLHTDFAFGGGVTYHGISLPVNDAPVPGHVTLSWNVVAAPIVMPSVVGGPFTISEPFSVTDHVGFNSCQNCIPGVSSIDGSGVGIATFSFAPFGPSFPNDWIQTSAAWTIMTPEPSAIMLVATVLGGLGVCAWRHLRFRRSSAP
jgi:hypothetical protein